MKANPMDKTTQLSLKRLILANFWGFLIPVIVGSLASLAGIGLLGISGWFITAAGLATALGLAPIFNYLTPGAIVRFMAILRTAGRYGEQVTAHHHLLDLLRILRLWVWDQRVAKNPANLHEQTRGDLLQRLVSDLDQIILWPLMVLLPWIYASLSYIAVSILAYTISPNLLFPMSIAGILHVLVVPYLCGHFASHQVHVGQILGVHRRSRFISLFSALVTLTIRGHWNDYAKRLAQLDARQRHTEIRIQNAVSLGRLLGYCITACLIGSSLYLISSINPETGRWLLLDNIQGTWVVAFILSILAVNELVLPLVQAFVAQGKSQVGLRRLNQLHQDPNIATHSVSANLERPLTQISLQNWRGFHAPSGLGNVALDVSIEMGETIWIRGGSGSGKSTLLASIAGDCLSSGRAFINGEVCDLYGNSMYQKQISYLPQFPYIFQQTIAANLRLGNAHASNEELWSVLEAVSLAAWVKSLPNALQTQLSSQGSDLSGGQRKRLALARLLLRQTPILLLDEPFDGLDKATIATICRSLQHGYKPDILVLVSHIESDIGESARRVEL